MSTTEKEYQARMAALTGRDRVARAMAMFEWTREMLARQIRSENRGISEERLKWEVALRLYGANRETRQMIEGKLANVSD